jgi:Ni,Fe-hydrogenase III small subunit
MNRRQPIRIYRMNTGSCGGCDVEIAAAVAAGTLAWASSPAAADALVLTGPLLPDARPAFDAALRQAVPGTPLVAVGRCAIDGRPFGRGGLAENPAIPTARKVDGCAPAPAGIVEALQKALTRKG